MVSLIRVAIACATGVASAAAQNPTAAPAASPLTQVREASASAFASKSLNPEMRADIMMARKMYREAAELYSDGATSNPVLSNKLGIAYHQMLQLDTARRQYERAIKLNPHYAEAINNLGTIYYAQKKYRRAV